MAGEAEGRELSERDLVESLLHDLDQAAQRWEERLAEAESTAYEVDLGDVHAVANADGRLVELRVDPAATTYDHHELEDRLNVAFGALRREAHSDFRRRCGDDTCH